MSIVVLIPILAAIGAFGVVAAFYLRAFGGLPHDKAELGQFGDFVGGLLNPWLSLWVLLFVGGTLVFTGKQVQAFHSDMAATERRAREAAADALLSSQRESLLNTFRIYEQRLERLYQTDVFLPRQYKNDIAVWSLYMLMNHATDDALRRVPPLQDIGIPNLHVSYMRSKNALTQLHITLVKMTELMTDLTKLGGCEDLVSFYEPTVAHLARRLTITGYLPDDDATTMEVRAKLRQQMRRAHENASYQ